MSHSTAALYERFRDHPEIVIDSRKVTPGSLFFALGVTDPETGQARGNRFAESAIDQGAALVVISDPQLAARHHGDPRYWLVEDGVAALQALAAHHRDQLELPVLAIAGSNGKTTTKLLSAALLSRRYRTFFDPGNFNGQIGLPLCLLRIDAQHEIAVLEIGADQLGQTARLCRIARPTHGVVTNCGRDHLESYGSVENVIKANGELYDWLSESGGVALVNSDDSTLMARSQQVAKRMLFGDATLERGAANPPLEVTGGVIEGERFHLAAEITEMGDGTRWSIESQLFGRFWLSTLLTAWSVGRCFAIDPEQRVAALEGYQPGQLRSQSIEWRGRRLLLDCYNANPSSMEAFLDEVLALRSSDKLLVIGAMLELGPTSRDEHRQLLRRLAAASGVEQIILVGCAANQELAELLAELAAELGASAERLRSFADYEAAKRFVQSLPEGGADIFVKGSRGVRLERIFDVAFD